MITGLTHVGKLYTCAEGAGQADVGLIEDGAFLWDTTTERIVWVGKASSLPREHSDADVIDLHGRDCVTPALIDCHTHLAFGGWRAEEFALKCKGATYQELLAAGGGILSTVRKTRALSADQLLARADAFLSVIFRKGVGLVECKSGYGLTLADELKLLEVYQRLAVTYPGRIVSTLLAAHVVPEEYRGRRADYIKLICEEIVPQAAERKLAEFCDVFVEEGAFTPDEARTILEVGKRHGLRPKLHADQLGDGGVARLAAEVGAISADHLEFASDEGLRAMADAGVIAVALPLASLYLRQPALDARRCLERGVRVAVATDFNPGSAPCHDLRLALTLACVLNRLSPSEALKAATLNAARAVGREADFGSLEVGKRADYLSLDTPSIEQWLYHYEGT